VQATVVWGYVCTCTCRKSAALEPLTKWVGSLERFQESLQLTCPEACQNNKPATGGSGSKLGPGSESAWDAWHASMGLCTAWQLPFRFLWCDTCHKCVCELCRSAVLWAVKAMHGV
jgi:hypothetical protein